MSKLASTIPRSLHSLCGLQARHWRCAAATLLACGAVAAPAGAEKTITAQTSAANGMFLPWATAPAQPAGLCLVDTGVNVTPDTQSTVVYRTAIDGGSGDDVSPTTHGTVLAMMASAPANGWGTVGIAPRSIQIVSVRILEPGQTTFPFSSYATGIDMCLQLRKKYNIGVVNLSLGSTETPSSQAYETVGNAVQEARDYGVAVVAAAGNDGGGPVEYPAAYPGVLSVAASDTQSGGFCSFSNRGEGVQLIAPGCDLDGADPSSGTGDYNYWQGTSEASAIAASALAALRAYRPDLSAQAAQEDLTDAHSGALDIVQAFRNAALNSIVATGEAAEPAPEPASGASSATPPQDVSPSSSMTPIVRFQSPRARLRRLKRRFVLSLGRRPPEAVAQIRYLGYKRDRRHLRVLRALQGAFTTLSLPASVVAVSARFIDPYDVERSSPWITLKIPRTRSAKGEHA
jgi:hypothetical protein